ncbi:MAG: YdeI/OmpD-associated family protein [Acidimicrobiales bacterium]
MAADAAARAAFDRLSYTHRREYVEWIAEAKRPATRARRVAETVERVRAGAREQ